MDLDASVVGLAAKNVRLYEKISGAGAGELLEEEWRTCWKFVSRCVERYGKPPSAKLIEQRFDVEIPDVSSRDWQPIVDLLHQRKKHRDFLSGIEHALRQMSSFREVDDGIAHVRQVIEKVADPQSNGHFNDPFSRSAVMGMIEELEERQRVGNIMTGLPALDQVTGGFRPRQFVVVSGRPNEGKTTLSLHIIANAIEQKKRVLFYSLEMGSNEVYAILYTIFSHRRFPDRAIRNLDISRGLVKKKHLFRAVQELAPVYRGRLRVASENVECTLEQIALDVDAYMPDMVWIDYLTLMPRKNPHAEEWMGIRELSRELKKIARNRRVVIGCCAQLNRTAAGKSGKPSIEALAGSDGIGQDADIVIGLKQEVPGELRYVVPKNRGGPKIMEDVFLKFDPDIGLLQEIE